MKLNEEKQLKVIYRDMFKMGLLDDIDHEMQIRIAGFETV